jgi:hypothetical protein
MGLILFTAAWLLWGTLGPAQASPCAKETRNIGGRLLDVYVCRGVEVAVRAVPVNVSDCVPGVSACLGQTYGMPPAGEAAQLLMRSLDDPYPTGTHLATFPFSYCLPEFPELAPRDPYLRLPGSGQEAAPPARGLIAGGHGMVAVGTTSPRTYPLECYYFYGLRLAEILANQEDIRDRLRGIPGFIVREIREVRSDIPFRKITAYYGYSEQYFDGLVFHEGLDTSCGGGECQTQQRLWTPVPIMPVIVYPGWMLGMMPCNLSEEAVRAPYPAGGQALLRDIRALLERRVPLEQDCALLFGGLHIVTDIAGTPMWAVRGMAARGLPLEVNPAAYYPAGAIVAPCAVGYANSQAWHCHYQAVALSGDEARELLRAISDPSARGRFIRPPGSDRGVSDWGGIYIQWVYVRSIDPLLVLFPDLAGDLDGWASHPLPSVGGVPLGSATLFAQWTGRSRGEFFPGMPDEASPSSVEARGYMAACRIQNKTAPGWGCKPVLPSGIPSYCNRPEPIRCGGNRSVLLRVWDAVKRARAWGP